MTCESCGSRRSVQAIKSGFQFVAPRPPPSPSPSLTWTTSQGPDWQASCHAYRLSGRIDCRTARARRLVLFLCGSKCSVASSLFLRAPLVLLSALTRDASCSCSLPRQLDDVGWGQCFGRSRPTTGVRTRTVRDRSSARSVPRALTAALSAFSTALLTVHSLSFSCSTPDPSTLVQNKRQPPAVRCQPRAPPQSGDDHRTALHLRLGHRADGPEPRRVGRGVGRHPGEPLVVVVPLHRGPPLVVAAAHAGAHHPNLPHVLLHLFHPFVTHLANPFAHQVCPTPAVRAPAQGAPRPPHPPRARRPRSLRAPLRDLACESRPLHNLGADGAHG